MFALLGHYLTLRLDKIIEQHIKGHFPYLSNSSDITEFSKKIKSDNIC